METELRIPKIKDGIVIDHIIKGKALDIVKVLGLDNYARQDHILTIGMNLTSKKQGSKDVIKIENKKLSKEELDKIAILCPEATVDLITNFKVTQKIKIEAPNTIENVIKCPNPKCITNYENAITSFRTLQKFPLIVKCFYCEKTFTDSDIRL